METRVELGGQDEIRELGDAFNSMADRLVELQEDIRKQERQVMFGRIAAGLVHDLSHPIQNIGNSCKLILKMWDDADYRETFRRMVEREMQRGQAGARGPAEHRQADPARAVPGRAQSHRSARRSKSMQALAETAGITLQTRAGRRGALSSKGTCSRSAASTATWW